MTTERDIIIERLEQKLASRDKEIVQMQQSLRESIIAEISKKFSEKINESIEMNKSFRDSILEQRKMEAAIHEAENKMDRIEHRLLELNSAYDGVMKELLDQKSIIHDLLPKKIEREIPRAKPEIKPEEVAKPPEKPKAKSEYIIAENYVPRERKKQQIVIEADEKIDAAEAKPEDLEQSGKTLIKRSERLKEGVEIFETSKKR